MKQLNSINTEQNTSFFFQRRNLLQLTENVKTNSLKSCVIRKKLVYLHSTAQHSTAQHSTAQHSTAQHSTAQHSTA
ncbi:hypothetical protein ACI763_06530 [Capnocytophaga canimorsus]|uniref:hypothetical protein n=1 Tax=Capnocytophaga canimorsus TaxID=28188 RepID=UPI0038595AE8